MPALQWVRLGLQSNRRKREENYKDNRKTHKARLQKSLGLPNVGNANNRCFFPRELNYFGSMKRFGLRAKKIAVFVKSENCFPIRSRTKIGFRTEAGKYLTKLHS